MKLFTPKKHDDARGFFCETHNESTFKKFGLNYQFVQDNHSLSRDVGTIRGLHFQSDPFAQDKLIRVLRGKIFDVAVDLRRSSSTFGRYVSIELSYEDWSQLLIPKGFAHGFQTLEPNTEVFYKVSNFYASECDRGVAWDDPDIGINWPIRNTDKLISEKDRKLPRLRDLSDFFA